MAKRSASGLRLDADFTEDTVGIALQMFLALFCFPRQHFSIELFSRAKERWLGADARLSGRISGFRPFYMQFKRPSAFPDSSSAKIVVDRKKLKLDVNPRSLYFQLRDRRQSDQEFQHNILLRLRRRLQARSLGDAAYVCPLFLDRSAYWSHVHRAGLVRWLRWRARPWELDDLIVSINGSHEIQFDCIPVLAEHISIPPHDKVDSACHRYSFTESGSDLCFHSPRALPDGARSLASFLGALSSEFLNGGDKIDRDTSAPELQTLIEAVLPEEDQALDYYVDYEARDTSYVSYGDDWIVNWLAWGDRLRRDYAIDQFALVRWRDGPLF